MPVFIEASFLDAPRALLKNQGVLAATLQKTAEAAAAGPLYSVTFHKAPVGGPNDYCSQAPYWWPDEQGRFVRRDGHFYPGRFLHHRADMAAMADASLTLAQAGYYLRRPEDALRAAELLRTWFIDPKTRMNPHLNHAQAIPGVCEGRSLGIIDTIHLLKVVHGAAYLSGPAELTDGLKDWFSAYLDWLMNSGFGRQERAYHNNHAAWWHVQAAAYAAFTGAWGLFDQCLESFLDHVLPAQLTEQGAFADEITRADAMHYSLFNLDAFVLMAELAYVNGRGLVVWQAERGPGRSIRKAMDFLLPYLTDETPWPYTRIAPLPPGLLPLQLGALRLDAPEYRLANRTLQKAKTSGEPLPACPIGALCLLPGFDPVEERP